MLFLFLAKSDRHEPAVGPYGRLRGEHHLKAAAAANSAKFPRECPTINKKYLYINMYTNQAQTCTKLDCSVSPTQPPGSCGPARDLRCTVALRKKQNFVSTNEDASRSWLVRNIRQLGASKATFPPSPALKVGLSCFSILLYSVGDPEILTECGSNPLRCLISIRKSYFFTLTFPVLELFSYR
jgi:hypothetical protein